MQKLTLSMPAQTEDRVLAHDGGEVNASEEGSHGGNSDDSVELIRYLPKRRTEPESADQGPDGFTERPLTFPCGRSFAATRVKGRGFIAPRPLRPDRGVQTEEACPFQVFLRGDGSAAHIDDTRSFWLGIAREVFDKDPRQTVPVPSNGAESWEAISCLDHENGVPAEEFLRMFTVCLGCRNVVARYWAEDHVSVCPATGNNVN